MGNRVIDLSQAAAKKIGMKEKGLATVKIETDSVLKKAGDATAQNTKSKGGEKKKIARQ